MTEPQYTDANVRPVRQWSPIWIVPLAVIVIGTWMLFNHYQQQGLLVTLVAEDAEGLVAGKTPIKSRSVDVGQVVSVELSEDLKQVIVKARMKPSVSPLINNASQFWVVKPQIGRGGVSGLNTLLSGAYIELQPGDSAVQQLEHPLLNTPPIAPSDAPGVRVMLDTADSTSLAVGDPVLYRGYEVGTVEHREFNIEQRRTHYQLYIREPYNALVTENVRFWSSSGLSLELTAEGVNVNVGSAATLLSGGVSFDVMEGWPVGDAAVNGAEYQLFPDKQSILEGTYNQFVEYLVFFDESVRGLKSGAPVEYKGVRVGTVASVPFFFSIDKLFEVSLQQGIPVLVRIEAGRLYEKLTLEQLQQELAKAVTKGMRATLKTGNLLTGALFIDLDVIDELNPDGRQLAMLEQQRLLSQEAGYPFLPSSRSGLSNIEQKVLTALDKINNLPLDSLLGQGQQTLAATERLLDNVTVMLQKMEHVLSQPELQSLPQDIQLSLREMQRTLAGLSPGSAAYDNINSNLQSLDQVLRELQPVLRLLNQQSNALIFSAPAADDHQPQKAKP